AQACTGDVYAVHGVERGAPDEVEELLAVQDDARETGHGGQEVVLLWRQGQLAAGRCRPALPELEHEIAHLHALLVRSARSRARAPEDGANAGDQLVRVERLRDIIVGAESQSGDLVDVGGAGGEQ